MINLPTCLVERRRMAGSLNPLLVFAQLVTLWLLPVQIFAQAQENISVVMSSDSKAYIVFKERLKELDRDNTHHNRRYQFFDINQLDDEQIRDIPNSADLIVSVGEKSTHTLSRIDTATPIIASLLTKERYFSTLLPDGSNAGISCVVVIDQPLERIVKIIASKLPDIKKAGMIERAQSYINIASNYKTEKIGKIDIMRQPFSQDIHSTVYGLAKKRSDIIIAQHDSQIYNHKTARNILISSYHFNLPLIGYSNSFVTAGALMGIYSKSESLAEDVYKLINNPEDCRSGRVFHPSTYTIEINPQVARSLGIRINDTTLKTTIRERSLQ